MIYSSWTQLPNYPGNPKLEQDCWIKTFYDSSLNENIEAYVFGLPGSYFYTTNPKSSGYGYTMGSITIDAAKDFVDHVYHLFYKRTDIIELPKVPVALEEEFF